MYPTAPVQPQVPEAPMVPPTPKTNWLLPIVFLIIGILFGVGGLWAYQTYFSTSYSVVPATPTPSATPDITANWKTYTSPNNKYQFKYPANWIIEEKCTKTDSFTNLCISSPTASIRDVCDSSTCHVTGNGAVITIENTTIPYSKQGYCSPGGPGTISDCKESTNIYGVLNVTRKIGNPFDIQGAGIIQNNVIVVNFSLNSPASEISNYSNVLDQILATFQFLGQGNQSPSTYTNTTYKYQISYTQNQQIGYVAAGAQLPNPPQNAGQIYVYNTNIPDYSKRLVDISYLNLLIPPSPSDKWQKTTYTLDGIQVNKFISTTSNFDIIDLPLSGQSGLEVLVQKDSSEATQVLSTFKLTQ